jgi:hypothetical protein
MAMRRFRIRRRTLGRRVVESMPHQEKNTRQMSREEYQRHVRDRSAEAFASHQNESLAINMAVFYRHAALKNARAS